jgi:hypothetical protein
MHLPQSIEDLSRVRNRLANGKFSLNDPFDRPALDGFQEEHQELIVVMEKSVIKNDDVRMLPQ